MRKGIIMKKEKKGLVLPSSYFIILCIIVLIAIVTHFVPVDEPAALSDVLLAPVNGFNDSVSVILFILVVGGFLKIVDYSHILDVGIRNIVKKAQGKEILLIPLLMFLFSVGGTTYGMAEETLAFYPLIISTMVACGFDVLTGTATILLGMLCGVSGSTINPFSIGTAIDALKTSSGIEANQGLIILVGGCIWLSSLALSCIYVIRYAKRVKANKEFSLMSEEETRIGYEEFKSGADGSEEILKFTLKMKVTLWLVILTFAIMIIGLVPWADYNINIFTGWTSWLTGNPLGEWYYKDLSAWFVIMGVIIGKINGLTEKQIVKTIIKGASELVGVAIIVGFSKGISVIMSSTGFNTYLLTKGCEALSGVSTGLFSVLSYLVYTGLTMLIPSTSGLAGASIPTFGALAAQLGFAPEVMISTYIGAHFIVGLAPTAGVVVSAISLSKLEFSTWVKFFFKLFLMISVVNIIILSIFMTIL